ncbi:MAG: hypothetical protein KF893_17525 [Caldilineaceae bacterium]|nr:hypothetical protein [Caldilineaceae bacterium]
MSGNESLWIQGLIFSAIAIGGILLVAWWLYFSSGAGNVEQAHPASPRVAVSLAAMIALSTGLMVFGGYWDAAEHVVTGIVPGGDDFLWPPHLMIYGAFLLALLISIGGIVALAIPNWRVGVRDPRLWVRRNPYVGAAALAAGYGLLSVPGDAIWHLLFGIDLTAWSPPHIFIAVAGAAMPLSAIGLLFQGRKGAMVVPSAQSVGVLLLLALAFHLLIFIGVLEWEVGRVLRLVAERPIWLYPVLVAGISFFALILGRRLVPGPWTATTFTLLYFASRLGIAAAVTGLSGTAPRLTLVFFLGALLLDIATQKLHFSGWRRVMLEAGVFTLGFILVALPTIVFYLQPYLPTFTAMDHLLTIVITFAVCAFLHPLAVGTGGWLRGNAEQRGQDVRYGKIQVAT